MQYKIKGLIVRTWLYLLTFILVCGCSHATTKENTLIDNHCEVVEKIVNLPELQKYYHVEAFPDRVPLIVLLNHSMGSCSNLKKFNSPVIITESVKDKKFKNKPYIKVNIIINDHSNLDITFFYEPEGIKGKLKLQKSNSYWSVKESKIIEI